MQLSSLYSSNPYQGKVDCAVSVVRYNGMWLLGLSTSGRRKGSWCFPGGMMDKGESPKDCAARECQEETGIAAYPVDELKQIHYRCVAILCDAQAEGPLSPNSEFSELKWFTTDQVLNSREILPSNKELVAHANKYH